MGLMSIFSISSQSASFNEFLLKALWLFVRLDSFKVLFFLLSNISEALYFYSISYYLGKTMGFSLITLLSKFYSYYRFTGITSQLLSPLFFFIRLTSRVISLSRCWIKSFSLFISSADREFYSSFPTKDFYTFLLKLLERFYCRTFLAPPFLKMFLKQQKHQLILRRSLRIIDASGSSLSMYSSIILWHYSIQYLSKASLVSQPPFNNAIQAFSCAFSFFKRAIMIPGSTVSFLKRSFLMRATLIANLHVAIDYKISSSLGLIVATILVLQLPPRESLRTMVIKDSLQGICTFYPLAFLFNSMMTRYKQCSPKFMLIAYLYNLPSTPVCFILQDPERSTKCTDATVFMSLPGLELSMLIIKMQWDRVDSSFLGVLQTTLFISPMKRQLRASYSVWQVKLWRLLSCNYPLAPSLGWTFGRSYSFLVTLSAESRSYPID